MVTIHCKVTADHSRDPTAAELVKLRCFAGLTHQQAAELLDLSRSGADRAWVFARAWLYKAVCEKLGADAGPTSYD